MEGRRELPIKTRAMSVVESGGGGGVWGEWGVFWCILSHYITLTGNVVTMSTRLSGDIVRQVTTDHILCYHGDGDSQYPRDQPGVVCVIVTRPRSVILSPVMSPGPSLPDTTAIKLSHR